MNSAFQAALVLDDVGVVASPRIERGSRASETLILSIVLRGQVESGAQKSLAATPDY